MKNIGLPTLAVLFLAIATLALYAMPAKQVQEFHYIDSYVMQEPFSASPLITYPSLEASREG